MGEYVARIHHRVLREPAYVVRERIGEAGRRRWLRSRPIRSTPSRPEWGTVFVVPWDTDIFGFPVGTYQPGEPDGHPG